MKRLAPRCKIVLNRVGSECDISLKKAEETIGKPIYWQMPNDPKSMMESRNQGSRCSPMLRRASCIRA